MQRLVRRGRAVLDAEILGAFGELWGRIKSEWEETATLHIKFAENILDQVEKPVRDCATREESWLSLRSLEISAQKLAKELEEKENKLSKAKKGSSTGLAMIQSTAGNERRMADLAVRSDELRAQWRRDASTLLLRYETVDRSRLNNLKEAVTKLQTLQSDHGRAHAELLDRTLAIAFDFDPEEDIARVCAATVGTEANNYGGGNVYMNGRLAHSSQDVRRSTLSLPSSPRLSASSESVATQPRSATPSRSDLRRGVLATTVDVSR
jgi:hypothetical protein